MAPSMAVYLKAPYLLAIFPNECQELDVHLDVMPWNLFVVTLGMNLAHASPTRKPVHTIAAKNTRHRCVRLPYVVVSLKIPNDPHWPQVVCASRMKNFF